MNTPTLTHRGSGVLVTGLQSLVARLPNNCIMAEIGSYRGDSAFIFASSGKITRLICVDPWRANYSSDDGSAIDCDRAETIFDCTVIGYEHLIEKKKMNSADAIHLFDPSAFDFVYIDANHEYEHVKEDITLWLTKIKKGGYIGGHDYGKCPGVRLAVDEIFGKPDELFEDSSWLKKV